MERLSNDMSRVVRLTSWHEPIPEGYFPKLDNVLANRVWPPRPANTKLSVSKFTIKMYKHIRTSIFVIFITTEHQQRSGTD